MPLFGKRRIGLHPKNGRSAADRQAIDALNINVIGKHGFVIKTKGVNPELVERIRAELARHGKKIEPAKEDPTHWFIR